MNHPTAPGRAPFRCPGPLRARGRHRADHRPRTWIERDDFTRFIHYGAGSAAIDWEAAVAALDSGELPGSASEKRMLRLAASLAGQAPICLGDAVTGIDDRNVGLLVTAIQHASGQRQSC
jgi:hypothetical protein